MSVEERVGTSPGSGQGVGERDSQDDRQRNNQDDGQDVGRSVGIGQDEDRRDDDRVRDALGKLRKALETTERARGRLYDFHQMTGTADFELGDAVRALREAGLGQQADLVERELVGRNVIGDRWTFQIVEDYDDGYYASFRRIEEQVRQVAGDAPRHGYEQQLKDGRRTHGRPGHEAGMPSS